MIKLLKFLGILFGFLLCGSAHGTERVRVYCKDAKIDVTTDKVAHLIGGVDNVLEVKFFAEMTSTMDIPGPRIILIDTQGGNIDDGDHIIDRIEMEKSDGVNVICLVTDKAQSMGFNILTHCSVRLAAHNATLMFHDIALGEWPKELRMTAKNLRDQARNLDADDRRYRKANLEALRVMSDHDYRMYSRMDHDWKPGELRAIGYLHGVLAK